MMADQMSGLLSPLLQKIRIKTAMPFLKGTILDYGCGTGKLADFFPVDRYVGVDLDRESIDMAKINHPHHRFYCPSEMDKIEEPFDVIVIMAVIEHVDEPQSLLHALSKQLKKGGKMVITTPHPLASSIHTWGSYIGIFSREGRREHRDLLNRYDLLSLAQKTGLELLHYRRFMFGFNQLAVLVKGND